MIKYTCNQSYAGKIINFREVEVCYLYVKLLTVVEGYWLHESLQTWIQKNIDDIMHVCTYLYSQYKILFLSLAEPSTQKHKDQTWSTA